MKSGAVVLPSKVVRLQCIDDMIDEQYSDLKNVISSMNLSDKKLERYRISQFQRVSEFEEKEERYAWVIANCFYGEENALMNEKRDEFISQTLEYLNKKNKVSNRLLPSDKTLYYFFAGMSFNKKISEYLRKVDLILVKENELNYAYMLAYLSHLSFSDLAHDAAKNAISIIYEVLLKNDSIQNVSKNKQIYLLKVFTSNIRFRCEEDQKELCEHLVLFIVSETYEHYSDKENSLGYEYFLCIDSLAQFFNKSSDMILSKAKKLKGTFLKIDEGTDHSKSPIVDLGKSAKEMLREATASSN